MIKTFTTNLLLGIALAGIFSACSLFEYHPYETNVHDRNLNAKAIDEIIAATAGKDTLTVISMGDSQRFYDELEDFVKSANTQEADFVFLNGDITDFGLKDEYEWIHDIMKKLRMPYVAVIGNHDLSGNGEEIYKKMYGLTNQTFTLNRHKFIMMNTNGREYHFDKKVPDIPWLNEALHDDATFDYATVVSHIPPFDSDFDLEFEHDYANALSESGRVKLSLHAHKHTFKDTIPYGDGIRYLVSTSMDERMYLLIKFFNGQYTYKKIYF
jgi:3',5'-cyclic AMP phosphodiesterase CpdA